MYNDMYNTFDKCHFEYNYPFSFERGNKDYLQSLNPPMFEWKYGDTINLHIEIYDIDEIIDDQQQIAIDALGKYTAEIKFYNFRYEEILSLECKASPILRIDIDREDSINIFKKGNYFLSVTLINKELNDYRVVYEEKDMPIYVN